MDAIFKALSDPTRRALLDSLRKRDGQTLTELEAGLGMTRFGVMKHLAVLEDANLVITRKAGRFKYHYLNAAPIQEVADRWIAPYAKPLARFAMDLKNVLEGPKPMRERPTFVLETFIKTTPEKLWEALTNPQTTSLYYFGTNLKSDLTPGGPFQYYKPDGTLMLDGEVIEVDPMKKIVSTFIPIWEEAEPTRVTFDIEPMGEVVKFTITHHDVDKTAKGVATGWSQIASSLKSLLETGVPITYPQSM
ncbi:ArsR/SmtB family transcription factor [Devosia nitrariae]|uniref:ArsR/SmtB family transcription factor n=1 Tax=Devosia nitrariae TaxID=2071872 RepID=UPI0035E5A4D5